MVPDRVQVRDFQAVGDDRACGGTSARAHHRPHRAGGCNIVLDDQEVVRETHAADGLELEVDALLLLRRERLAVALVRALVGQMTQVRDRVAEAVPAVIALLVAPARVDDLLVLLHMRVDVLHEGRIDFEHGQNGVAVDGIGLHLVQDLEGVGDGFRVVREQAQHLLLALEVFLLRIAQAGGIVQVGIGGQADEAVVDGTVLLADEVHVVRGDDLHVVLFGQLEDDLVVDHLVVIDFARKAGDFGLVEHYLQVVVVPEHFLVPVDDFIDLGHVAGKDRAGHLARHAGAAADESLVVLLQHLVADPGAVIHTLDVRRGNDLHQVLVPLQVLRQKDQVIVPLLLHAVVPHRHVRLASDDGLDPRMLLRELEELLDTEHVAVVRDGQAGLAQLLGPVEQVFNGRLTVQDGILGMYVQMDEGHGAADLCKNKDSILPRISRKKLSTTGGGAPPRTAPSAGTRGSGPAGKECSSASCSP